MVMGGVSKKEMVMGGNECGKNTSRDIKDDDICFGLLKMI
jgi:hypothetical protein